jgi:tight adherence protein B
MRREGRLGGLFGHLHPVSADEPARAEALRALAALLRTGMSPRAALGGWHRDAPASLSAGLGTVARRLELGADIEAALGAAHTAFAEDHPAIVAAVTAARDSGGDWAALLEGLAHVIENRAAARAAARAAGGGAQLSARLVAGLPLASIPLVPAAGVPVTDTTGTLMLVGGLLLCGGGIAWIERLFPSPPPDDGAANLASLAAALLRGGCGLHPSLEIAALWAPSGVRDEAARAARFVRLGQQWPSALGRAEDEGLRRLGTALASAQKFGLPVAGALEDFATRRRAAGAREFDRALRRAPVLMVIPLTLCVLPSFVLLGLGPFLRGMSLS